MPRFEIDIEDGNIKDVPAELKAILDRIDNEAHGRGFGKGAEKTAAEAKGQIEAAVRDAIAKREALEPMEREKWATIEADNKALRTQISDYHRESAKVSREREELHASELLKRAEANRIREDRIRELTRGQIRSLAQASGARDESLDELSVILWDAIGFDDEMKPFVKTPDGKQHMTLGKPTDLPGFVKKYLEEHPHHRKSAAGQGGGSRGGHSFQTSYQRQDTASFEDAKNRIDSGDRSNDAINELFEASRRKRQPS